MGYKDHIYRDKSLSLERRLKELEAGLAFGGSDAAADLVREVREADERLRAAVNAIYFAAHWAPDRQCDASGLWTELRDAAAIEPGQTVKILGSVRT